VVAFADILLFMLTVPAVVAGAYSDIRRACVNRHSGLNAVFMDGSVRKIGLKHLWVQRWYRSWEEDLAATGLPAWPEWMADFPEP